MTLAKDTNDYVADTLAHGLVTLLGPAGSPSTTAGTCSGTPAIPGG